MLNSAEGNTITQLPARECKMCLAATGRGRCPLCESEDTQIAATQNVAMLSRVFQGQFGFRPEFPKEVDTLYMFVCNRCALKHFEPSCLGDEELYKRLQKFSFYYSENRPEFAVARKYLRDCKKVLEIGAGAGAFGATLNHVDYVGLEFSREAAQRAKTRGLQVECETLEQHLARVGSGQYDAVCAFEVLEHVGNPRELLHQAFAALARGGIAFFSVPNDEAFTRLERNNVLNMPPHHQTRWRKAVFEYLANIFDVELVACEREKLADSDLDVYLNAMLSEAIDALLGRQRRELDPLHASLPVRAARKAVTVWLRRGLKEPAIRPDGQSMAAVLRKR